MLCQHAMFKSRLGCGGPRRVACLFKDFFRGALCFLACFADAAAVDAGSFLLLLCRWECVSVLIVSVFVEFAASIASSVFCFDVRVLDKVNVLCCVDVRVLDEVNTPPRLSRWKTAGQFRRVLG